MERGTLDPAIAVVQRVYGEAATSRKPKHPHDLLADEVAGITELHVPEVDYAEIRDIQMDYLRKRTTSSPGVTKRISSRSDSMILPARRNGTSRKRLDGSGMSG